MDFEDLQSRIRYLLSQNDLDGVFKTLKTSFQEENQINSIVLKSRRYVQLKQDKIAGYMKDEVYLKQINRLSMDILEFIDLEKVLFQSEKQKENNLTDLQQIYLLSLTRLSVLKILDNPTHQTKGLTHSDIYKKSTMRIKKFFRCVLEELETANYLEKHRLERKTFWRLTESGVGFTKNLKKSTLFEE